MDRPSTYLEALDAKRVDILDRCTACGRCAEVCPMTGPAGLKTQEPADIVSGVLDILRDGDGPDASRRWAERCGMSGECLDACDDGVNPRFMLSLARLKMKSASIDPEARNAKGRQGFRTMSVGVKTLSRLQLPPDLLQKVGQGPAAKGDAEEREPNLVFYTGCNILKTPHIALLAIDILDRLDLNVEVMGGPAHCCGIIQGRAGDGATSGKVGGSSLGKFAASKSKEVLSWCPTCQITFAETLMPAHEAMTGERPFEMTPFMLYLQRRLDDLKPKMVHRVDKRVGLLTFPGNRGVPGAAEALLRAVPGLELVDLPQPGAGHMITGLATLPDFQKQVLATTLDAAEEAGVDILAAVYHGDHRALCGHQADRPFEIVNFLEPIAESLGLSRHDRFKELLLMRDVDAILAETADLADAYKLPQQEVRDAIAGMLGGAG